MTAPRQAIGNFISGLILAFLIGGFFIQAVLADTTSTQVTVNATVTTTGGGPVCGDGVVEGGEECDDAGSNGACPATCSATCTTNVCSVCGNGVVESGELCDNGGSNGSCPATCSNSCTTNSCNTGGNGAPTITVTNIFENLPESTITWTAVDNDGAVSECTIEVDAVDPATTLWPVSELGADTYSATPSTVLPLTTYFYDIRCTDDDGATAKKEGTFITPAETVPDTEAPVITDVTSLLNGTIVTVLWNATDNVAVESCVFQYNKVGEPAYAQSSSVEEGSFSGLYSYRTVIPGLIPATDYNYRIICVDAAGNEGSYLRTATMPADAVPPPAVSNFTATPQGNDILLTWSYDTSLSDFYSYRIHFSFTNPPPFFTNPASRLTVITDITTQQYLHQNVTKDIRYYYSIGVRDTSANWSSLRSASAVVSSVGEPVCGDGIVEGGEECDDKNTNDNDACTNSCTNAICGDQIVHIGEEDCDISNLNGNSCTSLGYDIGVLTCTQQCTFNTGACSEGTIECGDGDRDGDEECDDGNDDNNDACTNACTIAVCGDGVIRTGFEQCDTTNLNGNSCSTLGYDSGVLSCSPLCTLDAALCEEDVTPGIDPEQLCSDGVDNDLDGFIDCGDSDCSADPVCNIDGGELDTEKICNDGVDNDLDGTIDCEDLDCAAQPACQAVAPACSDGFDNDSDGLIDAADPGCEDEDDTSEFNVEEPTVDPSVHVTANKLTFLLAERTIPVAAINGVVTNLTGKQLTVIADNTDFVSPVVAVTLILQDDTYRMPLAADGKYYADIVTPGVGVHPAAVEVRYQDGLRDVIDFTINSQPYGQVTTDADESIDGTQVTLYAVNGGEVVWNASVYRQANPQVVREDGVYAYVVPNGTYRLVAEKNGFRERRTLTFRVTDNVINTELRMIALPETLVETIGFVGEVAQEIVTDVVGKVVDVANDPEVERVTERTVVPIAAGTSLVFVIPSLWSILFPLLRFLFLQPLLLIGQRKRESWGKVYHSLSKLPVDLAVVRLIDATTKRIVQSRVTDKSGRYLFMVEPGRYKIEVSKQGFLFPSANLAGVKEDGGFLDLYHGEDIETTEEATTLTPNIPLDPIKDGYQTVRRIIFERYLRATQHLVSFVGVGVTAVSLYITPTLVVGAFLLLHIILYGLFLRHVRPKKPKGWGIVYDDQTEHPVGRVVARLFTKKYNKLVATQLTDSKGRYSFLVGPNEYYVSFEKDGYHEARTDDIDYSDRSEDIITENMNLKRKGKN